MCLLDLPIPVLEYLIFIYLQKDDILKLACCSSDYCDAFLYLYLRKVYIHWADLKKNHGSLSESLITSVQYARSLNFISRTSHPISSPMEIWTQVVENYKIILDNCTSKVLKATIHGTLTNDGISYLCKTLNNLREVTFIDVTEISIFGWRQLLFLENLEKLTLKNCFIRNTGIEMLANMKNLKELHLYADWKDQLYITRNALKHISSMKKLKKLTISCCNSLQISKRDLMCLKILLNLEELSFEQNLVDDDALVYLLQKAKELKKLNISGCRKITERGLSELVSSPSLMEVNLQGINVSNEFLSVFSRGSGMKGIFTKGKNYNDIPLSAFCLPQKTRESDLNRNNLVLTADLGFYALTEQNEIESEN